MKGSDRLGARSAKLSSLRRFDECLIAEAAQTGQLRFLHKLCSPKSHRRQPVDCSVPSYRGHERFSAIPPAAAGGSFSPKLCFPLLDARAGIERSTGCRRWDSRAFLALCRPGLNDPPAAAGGIPESQNLCRNLSCPVCATVAETIFAFHYVLIRGFRLKSAPRFSRSYTEGPDHIHFHLMGAGAKS